VNAIREASTSSGFPKFRQRPVRLARMTAAAALSALAPPRSATARRPDGSAPTTPDEELTHADALARVEQLTRALATRTTIARAQGMLMERYDLDEDAAFQVLVRISQNTNEKLHAIAGRLVAGEQVDGLPPQPRRPVRARG
jgi:hypothetical protein